MLHLRGLLQGDTQSIFVCLANYSFTSQHIHPPADTSQKVSSRCDCFALLAWTLPNIIFDITRSMFINHTTHHVWYPIPCSIQSTTWASQSSPLEVLVIVWYVCPPAFLQYCMYNNHSNASHHTQHKYSFWRGMSCHRAKIPVSSGLFCDAVKI